MERYNDGMMNDEMTVGARHLRNRRVAPSDLNKAFEKAPRQGREGSRTVRRRHRQQKGTQQCSGFPSEDHPHYRNFVTEKKDNQLTDQPIAR